MLASRAGCEGSCRVFVGSMYRGQDNFLRRSVGNALRGVRVQRSGARVTRNATEGRCLQGVDVRAERHGGTCPTGGDVRAERHGGPFPTGVDVRAERHGGTFPIGVVQITSAKLFSSLRKA